MGALVGSLLICATLTMLVLFLYDHILKPALSELKRIADVLEKE